MPPATTSVFSLCNKDKGSFEAGDTCFENNEFSYIYYILGKEEAL